MNQAEFKQLKTLSRAGAYVVHGDVTAADCILVFSFGYAEQEGVVLPGLSNLDLAVFIEQKLPELPIIAQFEIADNLPSRRAELTIREHRVKGAYLDSREIILQAQEYMRRKGWGKVIVVTHPAMESRNDYLCVALGLRTIAPEGLDGVRYDPASEQPWTRNADAWQRREVGVLQADFEKGWLKRPTR